MAAPVFAVKNRDQIRDDYLRDYNLQNQQADISPGTQPYIDASAFADQMTAVYASAQVVANNTVLSTTSGAQLDAVAAAEGLFRHGAVGATGFVTITASTGGGPIFAGDEIRTQAGLRFQCTLSSVYQSGAQVPIAGLDTGPGTSLPAGTVLTWTSPRPGIGPTAVVAAAAAGSTLGLTGGSNGEQDPGLQARIASSRQSRPASGNDADYQRAAEQTPGVAVEKAFTYPAILGPGTIGLTFTVPSTAPGAGRRPTITQLQAVQAYVQGQMPADDMLFVGALLGTPLTVALGVSWVPGAGGWVDPTPWPPYYVPPPSGLSIWIPAPTSIVIDGATTTPTATSFTIKVSSGYYAGVPSPTAGQTIGLYNPAAGTFVQKRINNITGTGPWTVSCTILNNASDVSYVPVDGQRVSPWATSLPSLAAPLIAYVGTLGPGEQLSTFFDPGLRQKRTPFSPKFWPSTTTSRLATNLLDLGAVQDVTALEGVGQSPGTGSPGGVAFLLELADIGAFPK